MILPDLIERAAERHPERPALVFRDEPITYSELARRVRACATGLKHAGVGKGQAFGLLLRNSPEFVVVAMALARIGAVPVPINFLEKPDRIALILNDAEAVGLLTAREFYRHAAQAAKKIPTLKYFYLRDGEHKEFADIQTLMQGDPGPVASEAGPDDLMMLLYTSGTTGLPKGVQLTHRNFLSNVEQCMGAMHATEKDRFLCLLPLFHSFSWTACLTIPLYLGACSVIIESLLPFDPVIKAIWHHKITVFLAVPQIYSALVAKITGMKAFVVRLVNPIRLCISGAAPLPAAVHQAFEKEFGVPLLEGYGMTETSPVVSLNPLERRKVGTVGKPLPGVAVEIRDDAGRPVPTGEVGEIWVRGDNVTKGYFRKPRETAELLTPDGWLKSGDLGRFDEEGYLSIVDRKKDLIIVKGLNVYPQEVEGVILRHPAVKEVAVVGKPDPATGDEIIRAFVTLKDGMTLEKADVFALCRAELAPYKMPRDIVVIDQMPRNALQKILKKDLRER